MCDTGVIITMAGAGSRFEQAGYTKAKYEIEAHGLPLFAWSMHSLKSFIDAGSPFTFVARGNPSIEGFLAAQCRELGIRTYKILILDSITDGQATTALLARDAWDDISRPVAIYNIDTYVNPAALPVSAIRGRGWIPCFPGEGDKWSFAAAGTDGRITQVREKKRVSPHASIGLYWFDSFSRYADLYERYYADPQNLEARERYVAPLYNQLIEDGADVYLHQVPSEDVHPLGTPEDLEIFQINERPCCTLSLL
jgi:hypothetical protein